MLGSMKTRTVIIRMFLPSAAGLPFSLSISAPFLALLKRVAEHHKRSQEHPTCERA